MVEKVNISDALASFTDEWSPRNVATLNDYDIRLVHISGEFVWHSHDDTDELFLLIDGEAHIELRDGRVELRPGELVVIPKGVEHKPASVDGASLLLVEPRGTTNTGTTDAELPDHITTTAGIEL